MANTKQAKKRAGQSIKRRDRNRSVRSETRSVLKTSREAVETVGSVGSVSSVEAAADPATAATATVGAKDVVAKAASTLDVAVRKGVLHKKTASRLKSRIAKAANKSASK